MTKLTTKQNAIIADIHSAALDIMSLESDVMVSIELIGSRLPRFRVWVWQFEGENIFRMEICLQDEPVEELLSGALVRLRELKAKLEVAE